EWEIGKEHLYFAYRVSQMAERFVYSHEVAHILLNHTERAGRMAVPADFQNAQQLAVAPEKEHEADLLGWNLLVHVFVLGTPAATALDLQFAYAGAHLFLQLAGLLESVEDLLAIGTHPPAAERLANIREAAAEMALQQSMSFERVAAIAMGLDTALARVMERCPPLPGRSPIDELLSGMSIQPDYFSPEG